MPREIVEDDLAVPRQFMGGDEWEHVLRERVVPLLAPSLRIDAVRRIDALAGLDAAPRAVNHGDLAGSNVLWHGGRVSGVLDWDLTAWEDPAEDVASLASWHGWEQVTALVDAETAHRAGVFRDSFGLQIVAFAVINERPREEVARAVARAEARFHRDAG